MQIDWFTLAAQIVNFLILLYLLKRFLYQPILNTMDQREQSIADRLKEAEQKRAEAEQEAASYHRQQQELQEQRQQKMAEIQQDVEAQRKKLFEAAKQEIQSRKQDWQEALQREQENFLQELRLRVGQQAVEVARHAFKDLADARFEQQVAEKFIARMQTLDVSEKAEISDSIRKSNQNIMIRSTFELPEDLQRRISQELRNQVGGEDHFEPQFETSDDLISGIEMQVSGHRVAWTIRDYLDDLESQITHELERQGEPSKQEDEHGS